MKNIIIVSTLMTLVFSSTSLYSQTVKRVSDGPGQKVYFDAKDSVIRVDWLDLNGKLKNTDYGYAILKYKRDSNGNITEQSYFDQNEKPTVDNLNVHKWIIKYNEFGQKTYQAEFGMDGKLLKSKGNEHHMIWEWTYDKTGKLLKVVTTENYD